MTEHSDLNDAFEEQLARTARFRRAAFHVHSIQSHDWGKEASRELNDRKKFEGDDGAERFLDQLADARLELVCITDHMRSENAFKLARAAAKRDDITVLPGMEISCLIPPGHREAIHILVVYPPDADADVIERLFVEQAGLPGAAKRTGEEQVSFSSLTEVRRRVEAAGGLFLLAHVDQQPRGHRAYIRSVRGESAAMFAIDAGGAEQRTDISREYADHLAELNPHAVEVRSHEDRHHYAAFTTKDGRKFGFACVAGSDLHSVEALAEPRTVTHIKLSRAEIGCVREALAFHETRVRFAEDLPPTPSPRLVGVRLRGGGLFTDATIAFNENLNCLIGPRGCGKSTLIEALRYVLGQRPLLEDSSPPSRDDRSFAALAIATQTANLMDTEIELIYERDGTRRVLAATYEPDSPLATRVFTLDGEDCHVTAEAVSSAFPARIFSWSELETLGRQPRLQRLVVDRLAPALPELHEQARRHRAELARNRAQIAETLDQLDQLLVRDRGRLRRWAEFKATYDRLNTEEVKVLFADLDRERAQIEVLEGAAETLAELAEAAEGLAHVDVAQSVEELLEQAGERMREWWAQTMQAKLELTALQSTIDTHRTNISHEIAKRSQSIAESLEQATERADGHEAAIREKTNAESDSAVRRDQREQARGHLQAAAALREEYLQTYARLQELLAARGGLLTQLETVRGAVAAERRTVADGLSEKLADLHEKGPEITITVQRGADREAFERHLDEEFLSLERGGKFHRSEMARRLSAIEPTVIVYAIMSATTAPLTGADRLKEAEARKLIGAFEVFSDDEDAGVTVVSRDGLLDLIALQENELEDLVTIESGGRPVDRLSPGGRSSAMLPLIALSESVPLIIDQPEDNLDNRMVGQTLSLILARLKERRQIIVTTHNPNIVVGGDAEQVVVLDAVSDRAARVETTGNIDQVDVIDAVIKIMEGGREAFQERRRRYRERLGED